MKRPFTFRVLPALILLLAGSVILLQNQKTDREKYEDFILESFAPFEDIDITADENSKSPDQPDMAAYQEYLTTVDPELGFVPKKRLWEAYHYTRSLLSDQKYLIGLWRGCAGRNRAGPSRGSPPSIPRRGGARALPRRAWAKVLSIA